MRKCFTPAIRRVATLSMLVFAASAAAHHSGAMFDDRKSLTLNGSVKAFQWTSPHCWIELLAVGPGSSEAVEWSIEMGAPSQLYRGGLRPRSLKVGERLTVVIHPIRDGTHGGQFVSAIRADGKPLGRRASPPGGPRP